MSGMEHRQALELEMVRATSAFERLAAATPLFLSGGSFMLVAPKPSWAFGASMAALSILAAAISQWHFRVHRGQQVEGSTGSLSAKYGRIQRRWALFFWALSWGAFVFGASV